MRRICCFVIISFGLASSVVFGQFNIEPLSQISLGQVGASDGSDIWGWTDSVDGNEYALFGVDNGTAFVNVTDPVNPTYLGKLPTHTGNSIWRDIKVYQDHAYVVSEQNGPHGVQIFDLTTLRGLTGPPQTFSETAHYAGGIRSAHNIAINEDSGFAYVVGSNMSGGGLHILDLSNPTAPTYAGEFAADGYTHDAQIVNYDGPDTNYAGQEIAFALNEDTLTIVDVTNKAAPVQVARVSYPGVGYTHQGWISEDGQYFFLNDEFDSRWTHTFDISDLTAPSYKGSIPSSTGNQDHNLYVKGDYIYEANYGAGLRVFEISDPANGNLTEVAFYDTGSAWSVYPYFESGTLIVGDINNGLVMARLDLFDADFNYDGAMNCTDIDMLTAVIAAGSNDLDFDLTGDGNVDLADRDAWLADAGAENLASGNPFLLGDANLDGVVDGGDFIHWNDHKFSATAAWCSADFNADGVTDGADFIIWNSNKFTASDSVTAVPEPNLMGALLVLVACFWRARR
jgi:choice-of-anchor B domain-containing protein